MFDSVKTYVIAGLVGVVLLLGLGVWYLNRTTHEQDKEIVTTKVENDSLKDAAKKDEASDKNTDTSVAVLVQKNDEVKDSGQKVLDTVNQQRQKVDQKYNDLPKTPDNSQAKIDEKSQLVLDTLWNQYCGVYSDNATCVKLKGQQK